MMRMMRMTRIALALGALLLSSVAAIASPTDRPVALREVGFDQKLDQPLPLDLELRDESGNAVRLGQYFGDKPVLLSFAYYSCPMLCPMTLDGVVRSLRPLSWTIGSEFRIVTVSFDARDTPVSAAEKKQKLVAGYGRPGAEAGWSFLTGDEAAIRRLTEAVGFRFRYDAATGQFAHASGIVVVTPEGKISRYLYGIDFAPRDVRLSLVEASENKIGSLTDQLLLFCFHYDPATGKYGPAAMMAVRIGGLLTLAGLVAFVVIQVRHEDPRRSG